MHIKEYLAKIVEDGDKKEMQELSYMLDELVCYMKEYNHDLYCDYKMKLYEMAYGKVLTLEMAEEWVKEMQPMARWTYEETDKILLDYNLKINQIDFYVVMNMMYSDYGKVLGEDIETYIKMTKAFLEDKDAKDGKLYNYWKSIVK